MLGNNPLKRSYVVGYGSTYSQNLQHRGASIPEDGTFYTCNSGYVWLTSTAPNPNTANGGLVGGPLSDDTTFTDNRNSTQNEASTYNSASLASLIAGLSYLDTSAVPTSLLT
jgi:endoglucanase